MISSLTKAPCHSCQTRCPFRIGQVSEMPVAVCFRSNTLCCNRLVCDHGRMDVAHTRESWIWWSQPCCLSCVASENHRARALVSLVNFLFATTTATPMATTSAHFRLLDLSPELVEEIALRLGNSDLNSMRLASRECHFHLKKTFREVCFQHVSVLLCDEQSLQGLGTIAAHKQYGAAVQELTLLIGELPAENRSELVNTANFDEWDALRAAHDNLKTSGLGAFLLKQALK